jgi:prophage DNA circulation protein
MQRSMHEEQRAMHVTIRKYRKIEGDRKQIEEIVNREFVPLISKIEGFNDFYAFLADDGTLMSVSVFRDEKGAEESVRAAAKWVGEKLAKVLPEKPEVISGEVFAQRHFEKQKAA